MKLSPSQTLLLTAASNHSEQLLADFPAHLKGGALIKVLTSLGNAGLIAPHSRAAQGNTRFTITNAGFEALGLTKRAPITAARLDAVIASAQARTVRTREGSKQSVLIDLMKRPEGATLAQMVEASGWLAHTVRGCMAGALKKKLGLTIDSVKEAGSERTYRVLPPVA